MGGNACGVALDIGLEWELWVLTVQVHIGGCVVLIRKWLWVVWGCGGGLVMVIVEVVVFGVIVLMGWYWVWGCVVDSKGLMKIGEMSYMDGEIGGMQ